jgi:hypothetical protein
MPVLTWASSAKGSGGVRDIVGFWSKTHDVSDLLTKGEQGENYLRWLGGYFEPFWSVNPFWTPDFKDLPKVDDQGRRQKTELARGQSGCLRRRGGRQQAGGGLGL